MARPNNLAILKYAKQYEVPVILGSDAHFSTMIADYSRILPLLAETGFPEDLIINNNVDKFLGYLKKE